MMKIKQVLVLVALVVVLAALSFASDKKASVAVLDFESMGTDEYLGRAVSEIMRTALVSSAGYRVVERAQIAKALAEQKFQKSGLIDDRSAVEIGKIVGADFIIVGSVVKIGNAYTINSRLIDVKTGEAKLGKNVTGTDLNLLTAMSNELVENLFGSGPGRAGSAADKPGRSAALKPMDEKTDWQSLDHWEILNGEWKNAPDGSIIGTNGHILLKEEFRDYVLDVTAEHLSGPRGGGVSISTRCSVVPGGQKRFRNATSINQGYGFNFTFAKTYNVYNGMAGNWYPLIPDWQKYEYRYADVFDEAVNRVRIEAVGKQVTIYVNGRFLVRFTDTSHAVGAPLLWVQENTGEKVRFFNIRIERR
ncbi:MAG TPA: FlgO family outer membrane protein [Smithellaceae bacterium]|nr:FlgO family outer membrane protein [Smithellaceae bacterium]HRS83145.1 FlgO family outer membrane protein [Smithellaceae bacterium]HRV46059.1 FlgO family outer membrane protein [Smithellaceae bacterium]